MKESERTLQWSSQWLLWPCRPQCSFASPTICTNESFESDLQLWLLHQMRFIIWSSSDEVHRNLWPGFQWKLLQLQIGISESKQREIFGYIRSIRNIRSILGILILNSDSLWIHSDFQTPKFRVTFRLMPAVLPGELCKAMTARRLCQATLQGELSANSTYAFFCSPSVKHLLAAFMRFNICLAGCLSAERFGVQFTRIECWSAWASVCKKRESLKFKNFQTLRSSKG